MAKFWQRIMLGRNLLGKTGHKQEKLVDDK
jgi:hypothetical protein